jgi:hypothetical protein
MIEVNMLQMLKISLLLMLAAMPGCRTVTPHSPPRVDEHQKIRPSERLAFDGLRVSVQAWPRVIRPGGALSIKITARNTSLSPVGRGFANGCVYGYGILDEAGRKIPVPARGCTQSPVYVEFLPGESKGTAFRWTWKRGSVPPGVYYVRGGLGRDGGMESPPPIRIELSE